MKIDYYGELSQQGERIKAMLRAKGQESHKLKADGDRWRLYMAETLGEDYLPPMGRRELLSIIQNLGYILYEVWRLNQLHKSDDGVCKSMKRELEKSVCALGEALEGLKNKTSSAIKIRSAAYRLFAAWRNSFAEGCDPLVCDGYEAVGDAMLRFADALEIAVAPN